MASKQDDTQAIQPRELLAKAKLLGPLILSGYCHDRASIAPETLTISFHRGRKRVSVLICRYDETLAEMSVEAALNYARKARVRNVVDLILDGFRPVQGATKTTVPGLPTVTVW